MYNELFAAWKVETENPELGSLAANFYSRLVDYLQHLNQASCISSEKSVKAKLLSDEAANTRRMVKELISIRYNKIITYLITNQKVPGESLTAEEENLSSRLSGSTEDYNKFMKALLSGQAITLTEIVPEKAEPEKVEELKTELPSPPVTVAPAIKTETPIASNRRVFVRFLKPVPSIIGADMKSYGPFLVEDVASVPELNAKILVKQGLAKLIELS